MVFGAPRTLLIGGAITVAGAIAFVWRLPALRVAVRPIYIRLGILPALTPPED
jgi:hypothetical protein